MRTIKACQALRGINLDVRQGEIVGLAGVAGNGQRELADVITGLRHAARASSMVVGEDIANQPVRQGIRRGVSHIPEDRTHVGSAPNLSMTDNVIMKKYNQRADCARLDDEQRRGGPVCDGVEEGVRYYRAFHRIPRCACFPAVICSA